MKQTTHYLVLSAVFAALCAVCSQIAIPLPMVPINLALFAVHLSGAVLGSRYGTLSMLIYFILGIVGVPVFQGLNAGPGVLLGPTGGYITGYLAAAAVSGFTTSHFGHRFSILCISMGIGTILCYTIGTIWFIIITKTGVVQSLSICIIPFLPGDIVKILLAAILVQRLYPVLASYQK
ncbi:Biotin transporter BioY [Clostridiales bacterium CHKCI001]|nr:Biotin transporter BioY [Clostridiales bacterium CHKCI001]